MRFNRNSEFSDRWRSMAYGTSRNVPTSIFTRTRGTSVLTYGLALLLIFACFMGFANPDGMKDFMEGRGVLVLFGITGALILVSEISHQGRIRRLTERIYSLEKEKRLLEAEEKR